MGDVFSQIMVSISKLNYFETIFSKYSQGNKLLDNCIRLLPVD